MSSKKNEHSSASTVDSFLRAVAHAPPLPMELDPKRIGGFRIVRRLGEGGMGIVYLAEDEGLGRKVALKVPRSSGMPNAEDRRRFLREARAAASLAHPNVASVYQVGETDDCIYIAMECVDGETLRETLRRGPVPGPRARTIALQMAHGLAAAHAKGIVHRDFKPENVMVTRSGTVKLLDFGVATAGFATEGATGTADTERQLTRDGALLGTSEYMSPEQAVGMAVDSRCDVFAFGIVLYEMLSGTRPFKGPTPGELRASIARDIPASLSSLVRDIEAELDEVVVRCLAKLPNDRLADARAIVNMLESRQSVAEARSGSALALQWRPSRGLRGYLKTTSFGALIAALAASAALLGLRSSRRPLSSGPDGALMAPGWECVADHQCSQGRQGGPYHCNQRRHSCVEVPSVDCHVSAAESDLRRDDVVWIGGMFPLSTEPDFDAEMRGAELARQEFSEALVSSGDRSDQWRTRPIGLVVCDEGADPVRAARHLAEDIEVPAVLGLRAKSAIETVPRVFLKNGVLSFISLAQKADLTGIPEPAGEPRLIWRSTLTNAAARAPTSALLSDVIEPMARDRMQGDRSRPIRVAVVRSAAAHQVSDADFRSFRFNGMSALENGDNFKQFVLEDTDAGLDDLVARLAAFEPHIVYPRFAGSSAAIVIPLEEKWGNRPRPFYIVGSTFEPALLDFIGEDGERRHRFFALTNASSEVNAAFVLRYNLAFPRAPVTATTAPQPSYDAFYVLAYATFALGDSAIRGPGLSRAMDKLMPPGRKVQVGPASIFEAVESLRAGRRIDLEGALGSLDFDTATGEEPVDYAILCCGVDQHSRASGSVESGLVYSERRQSLLGILHCP